MSAEQSLRADYGFRTPERMDDPDDSTISRPLERAESSSPGEWSEELGVNVYGEENWILPGYGDPHPDCGDFYPDGVCAACGDLRCGTHSCGRRECPNCWGMWAKDGGLRATVRLQAFRESQPDDWHRQAVHGVFSPSEGTVQTIREFKQMIRRAYEIAQEKGMRGGLAVPHAYRPTDDARRQYRAADPEVGIWVWMRENDRPLGEQTEWSPHVHIIGATTPDMDPGDDDEDFWRVIGSFKRYGRQDRESYEEIYGAVRYLLSHATFHREEQMQVVRWFGCLANNSFTDADKPNSYAMSVIERVAEEVADRSLEEEADGPGDEDDEEELGDCRRDDCDGTVISVFAVDEYLRQAEPPREIAHRMQVARDWRYGNVLPPPGLKHPRTEADAREAFEAML